MSFIAVRDLIEERCGLRFDDSQRASLSAAVAARMHRLELRSEDEYYDRLKGAAPRFVEAELRNLLNLVTVTETCFFRDVSQFRLLREHIIPTLISERLARGGTRAIRIWSAGCSSGEEPYSIAMTVAETMPPGQRWDLKILATDIDSDMVNTASQGVYAEDRVSGVSLGRW